MNGTAARFLTLGVSLSGLVILGWVLTGLAAEPAKYGTQLTTDWSHRHLIFSRPNSADQLVRVAKDPRYWQQIQRRQETFPLTAGVVHVSSTGLGLVTVKYLGKKFKRDWSEDLGTAGGAGAGNYPAKFSFRGTTANCGTDPTPDYVVYSTGLLGSATQANIVAYDNLYSGCTGTKPTVYWAYNTSGQVLTSPLIAEDGSQVAFVQTDVGQFGTLVLIKWAASTGTVSLPATPMLVLPSAYSSCTAPCMTTIILRDASNLITDDTTSSVFYDYSNDIAWVGGARGWLHKITGVFKGVPKEVHASGFPVQVNAGDPNTLSSPVYDSVSQNVFVGDYGGYLYSVNSATALVTQSAELDFGAGIVEGPIVDSTNGFVYVFASSDGTTLCTFGTSACAGVYQLSTMFVSGDSGTEATAGTSVASGSTPNPMYIGGFDNAYYTSADATGNLYVCGNTGQNPAIYQIPISAGFPNNGSAVVGLTSAAFSPACSPVADVLNPNLTGGATERLFVSLQNHGIATGCGGAGCVMNFVDTPWQASTVYQLHQQILDVHLNIEEVTTAGTSGLAVSFSSTAGATKMDNGVQWVNQGALSAAPLPTWTALTSETKTGNRIVDSHGNIEAVTHTGLTGLLTPAWNTTVGGTTNDGTVVWINTGANTIAALPAAGGASGIIIDNTLNGALPGTSQVYFTTLKDQVCGTSGTGACAVQASQAGLD